MARRYTRAGPGWMQLPADVGLTQSGLVYHTSPSGAREQVDAVLSIAELHTTIASNAAVLPVARHVTIQPGNGRARLVDPEAGTSVRRPELDGTPVGATVCRLRELVLVPTDPLVGRVPPPRPPGRCVAVYNTDNSHWLWRRRGRRRELVAVGDLLPPGAEVFG